MKTLPEGVASYSRTPEFTEKTVPSKLLRDHSTKSGVWGVIRVLSGTLRYTIPSRQEEVVLSPDQCGIVEPDVLHHVTPLGSVVFYVEFYR